VRAWPRTCIWCLIRVRPRSWRSARITARFGRSPAVRPRTARRPSSGSSSGSWAAKAAPAPATRLPRPFHRAVSHGDHHPRREWTGDAVLTRPSPRRRSGQHQLTRHMTAEQGEPHRAPSRGTTRHVAVRSPNPRVAGSSPARGTSDHALTYGRIVPMTGLEPAISIVPANEASWNDLQTVFSTRGQASRCQCQRYKLRPREFFAGFPAEERAGRLREQTDCGYPESDTTSGLVAYLDNEPVGWCAVEARTAYAGLLRNHRVPWVGRAEDKTDDSVWAVTCLLTRAGFRKRGVSRALAGAAVGFARERGARALEGYPHDNEERDLRRAPRRHRRRIRRCRLHRGQPSDTATCRDAGRLLDALARPGQQVGVAATL